MVNRKRMRHRAVLPQVLIGLTVFGVLLLLAIQHTMGDGTDLSFEERNTVLLEGAPIIAPPEEGRIAITPSDVKTIEERDEVYEAWLQDWVNRALAVEENQNNDLREELFRVTVPSDYRALHLQLLIWLDDGNSEALQELLLELL